SHGQQGGAEWYSDAPSGAPAADGAWMEVFMKRRADSAKVLPFQAETPQLLDSLLADPSGAAAIDDATTISALQTEIVARQLRLAGLQAQLLAARSADHPRQSERMLTPEEAAARLGTSPGWVYKNWRVKLPFGVKVSPKQLRFSERKLERFLAMREAA